MWSTSAEGAALALLLLLPCCTPAPPPDPTHDLQLAEGSGEAAASASRILWVTRRAVAEDVRPVAALRDGGVSGGLEAVARCETGRAVALGVDRTARFGPARAVLARLAGDGSCRVELLLGDRAAPRALRVCAGPGASLRSGPDCWGRDPGRAPPHAPDAGAPGAAVAIPGHRLDADGLGRGLVPEGSLDLLVEVGARQIVLEVQGRMLRTIPVTEAAPQAFLATSLEALRRHNAWDRAAAVTVEDAVPWPTVPATLATLRAAGFEALRLALDR